jgi:hypothetical protein
MVEESGAVIPRCSPQRLAGPHPRPHPAPDDQGSNSIIAALRIALTAKDNEIAALKAKLRQRDSTIATLYGQLEGQTPDPPWTRAVLDLRRRRRVHRAAVTNPATGWSQARCPFSFDLRYVCVRLNEKGTVFGFSVDLRQVDLRALGIDLTPKCDGDAPATQQ